MTSRFQFTAFVSYSHAADGRLAEILQARLQTFAKPWYRRRAIRVFRDTTGLGLTPDLWESIRAALSSSEYFVLLASEQAARSQWVEQEVDAWLDMGFADRLLIVWTDGTLSWDRATGDFDWARTTCLPPRLRGALRAEPLHLDLRWARSSTDLSPRRPEFLDAVARLSSTLRGQPLDDLIGEDIRQHQRTRRLAGAAVATLSALLIGAVVAAGLAVQQRNIARQQSRVAEEQRAAAEEQRAAAERQRAEAERQREEADRQREAAETQRKEAERQQRVAEEQREASRQRLVQAMVANGLRRIDERDLSGSALWFAEALRLEAERPRGQELQRLRLRSTLDQHPALTQVWTVRPRALRRWVTFGRDGRYAVTDALERPDGLGAAPSVSQVWIRRPERRSRSSFRRSIACSRWTPPPRACASLPAGPIGSFACGMGDLAARTHGCRIPTRSRQPSSALTASRWSQPAVISSRGCGILEPASCSAPSRTRALSSPRRRRAIASECSLSPRTAPRTSGR